MRIHGNHLNLNAVNPYSAAAEKATAAQQAADVRKKLIKRAGEIEGIASPEEAFMLGQWMDSRHSQVQSKEEHHIAASGKDSDSG